MGIRTPDLLIANETLYQLSYTPNKSASSYLRDNLQTSCPVYIATERWRQIVSSLVGSHASSWLQCRLGIFSNLVGSIYPIIFLQPTRSVRIMPWQDNSGLHRGKRFDLANCSQ